MHRDIKPANLLFDDEGRVAHCRLRTWRALAEAAWTEPAGAMLGTARYASPEQARGSSVDGKADVYSLALVLCEAVTGMVPFAADTTIATLMARLETDLVVPAELGPLAAVLTEAGTTDPVARIDAGGLARALDAAARDLPRPDDLPIAAPMPIDITAPDLDLTVLPDRRPLDETIIGRPRASALFDVEADRATIDNAPEPPRRKRRKWPYVLLTAVLVPLLVAGAAWGVIQVSTPSHPALVVTGKTIVQANEALAQNHQHVTKRSEEYSETIPKDVIVTQTPAPQTSLKERKAIFVSVSKGPQPRAVPDLSGKNRAEVPAILKDFKLTSEDAFNETIAKDIVISWTPNDAKVHAKGSEVHVVFSKGKEPKSIPGFIGQLYDDWVKGVQGIFKVTRKDEFSDTVAVGQITRTDPPPNTLQNADSAVVVYVSKGPDVVTVPNIVGMKENDAVTALQQKGLLPGNRYGPGGNRKVTAQDPQPGTTLKRNATVDYSTFGGGG